MMFGWCASQWTANQCVAQPSCSRGGARGMGKLLRDNVLGGTCGDMQKYAIFVGCNRGRTTGRTH